MSKKRRKKKEAAGGRSAPIGVADPALPAIERERALSRAAYELFLAEGGGDLEALMENGQCTARAYTSQIRAAEEGGQGWGPTVTPYEDRMTRSLQLRLIKERRKWIEDCRQRIEAAIEAEREAADRAATARERPSETASNDIHNITETGERLAEEARTEAAMVEEAIAMAHEEIARERGRPVARAGP